MPLFQFIVVFPCSCYSDLLLPQLTTVDANQSESKEVLNPDFFIASDLDSKRDEDLFDSVADSRADCRETRHAH